MNPSSDVRVMLIFVLNIFIPNISFGFDQVAIDSLNHKAEEYRDLGKYAESVDIHQRLLEHFLEQKDSTKVAWEYFQIGRLIYYLRTKTSNAETMEYWSKGLELSQKLRDDKILLWFHRAFGVIYGEPGWKGFSPDSSRNHLFKAEKLATGFNDFYSLSGIQGIIGNYASVDENYEEAEYYLNKSLENAIKSDSSEAVGYSLCKLAEFYVKTDQLEKADEKAMESLKIFEELGISDLIVLSLGVLQKSSLKRKDLSGFVHFHSKIDSIQSEIYTEKNIHSFREVREKYESEKKEQQLVILESQAALHKAEIQRTRTFIFIALLFVVFLIASILIWNSRRRYKLKSKLAVEREEFQREGFKAVIAAEEKERMRIARELHDGLGQILSTARITVSALEDSPLRLPNALKLIDHAVKEVRSISHNMMPNALMGENIEAAIQDLVAKINESGGIKAWYQSDASLLLLPNVSIQLYRVIQEVLNNALKYAEASELKVLIHQNGDQYEIFISDDGKGFDCSKLSESKGLGWSNVQTRMQLIGGTVHVDSTSSGTVVHLTLPK